MRAEKIENPNTGVPDEVFFKEHLISDDIKKEALDTFESFKNKEKTITQLSLLKEKIRNDISDEDSDPALHKEVKKIFQSVSTNADANFMMGRYYNIKGDTASGAKHWKRSLEISEKFKPDIVEFLNDMVLEPILDGYDYKQDISTMDFMKEFKVLMVGIIKDRQATTRDKKKQKILKDLLSALK